MGTIQNDNSVEMEVNLQLKEKDEKNNLRKELIEKEKSFIAFCERIGFKGMTMSDCMAFPKLDFKFKKWIIEAKSMLKFDEEIAISRFPDGISRAWVDVDSKTGNLKTYCRVVERKSFLGSLLGLKDYYSVYNNDFRNNRNCRYEKAVSCDITVTGYVGHHEQLVDLKLLLFPDGSCCSVPISALRDDPCPVVYSQHNFVKYSLDQIKPDQIKKAIAITIVRNIDHKKD